MPEIVLPTKGIQDEINKNVGSNADASSPTGSIHAKLKDIKGSLMDQIKPIRAASGQASSSSDVNVISITGKGRLHHAVLSTFVSTENCYLTVKIDGAIVYYGRDGNTNSISGLIGTDFISGSGASAILQVLSAAQYGSTQYRPFTTNFLATYPQTSLQAASVLLKDPIKFNNSLQVTIKTSDAGGTAYGMVLYDLG
ncbi:hypothetical protein FOA22_12450 [Heyndrickxia oleronia]|uniref:hypothetical protein n=1 Tax=Heyndrickxia oleronia TaxID=38875 RepID=UPI00333A48E2